MDELAAEHTSTTRGPRRLHPNITVVLAPSFPFWAFDLQITAGL